MKWPDVAVEDMLIPLRKFRVVFHGTIIAFIQSLLFYEKLDHLISARKQ